MDKILNRYVLVAVFIVAVGSGILFSYYGTGEATPKSPEIILLVDDVPVTGAEGSYCWSSGEQAVCVDKIPPIKLLEMENVEVASISAESNLNPRTLNYPEPDEYSYYVHENNDNFTRVLNGSTEYNFSLDLEDGSYIVQITGKWDAGDSNYFFLVDFE